VSTHTKHTDSWQSRGQKPIHSIISIQYCPSKSLNTYCEVSLWVMCLSTITPIPCYCIKYSINPTASFFKMSCQNTLKWLFMYNTHVKSKDKIILYWSILLHYSWLNILGPQHVNAWLKNNCIHERNTIQDNIITNISEE
jgi:hypothetical protein